MSFATIALDGDWSTVRAAIADGSPDIISLANAAVRARDPETRKGLHDAVAASEVEGLLELHRCALRQDAAAIATLDVDDIDAPLDVNELANSRAMGRWTAAHIAAAAGFTDVLGALKDRGANLDAIAGNWRMTPLEVAVLYGAYESARWLLSEGAAVRRTVVESFAPDVPDEMLSALVGAGLDLDAWSTDGVFESGIMRQRASLAGRLALIGRLKAHGLPLHARLVYGLARTFLPWDGEDIPEALSYLLGLGEFDLDAPIVTTKPEEAEWPLIVRALRDWPIDAVRVLVDAGATVPVLRVVGTWPDAEAKRALLRELGKAPAEPDLAEYMTLRHDDITPERTARLLAGPGLAVAGIALGAPVADVLALGLEDVRELGYVRGTTLHDPAETNRQRRTPTSTKHEMHVWFDDTEATQAAYRVYCTDAKEAMRFAVALKDTFAESAGKPRGSKNFSWRKDGVKLSISQQKQSPWFITTVLLER